MKKYFLGLAAIVLAIGFSAFTIPAKKFLDTKKFEYQKSTFSSADVSSVAIASWQNNESASCTTTPNQQKACTITTDERYYHLDGNSGEYILNDHTYATDVNRESGDLEMTIVPQFTVTVSGIDYYNVNPTSTTTGTVGSSGVVNKTF